MKLIREYVKGTNGVCQFLLSSKTFFEVSCSTFGYVGYQKTSLDQSEFGIS